MVKAGIYGIEEIVNISGLSLAEGKELKEREQCNRNISQEPNNRFLAYV